MGKIIKTAATIIGALGLLLLAYLYLKPAAEQTGLSKNAGADAESTEIIRLLDHMNSIHIDATFFASGAFKSLKDMGTDIGKEPFGKTDPFAAFGAGNAPGSGADVDSLTGSGGTSGGTTPPSGSLNAL